ncbi:hypothetical protein DSAG12_01089 [Promethearchaeum syntrophicum]|uniref:Uncharacterized protein n=1 Tax=Promethearchaeum syntrophicum TaxID=2594042 RepID=A0A5B9D806_9ARCH|nr:hypothetical protein [Candidatus Prometheoarchaeum syntrophicum]QEE15264.1 hypothetical protein DSAG12_01089 [Candidatus Prometheoarchaeum syntrophicum]
MTESKLTKPCTNCGATLKLSPENIVITCEYCGETYDVDFNKVAGHKMIPTKSQKEIRANVTEFLKKNKTDINSISIDEVKANYLPYWIVPFKSHTEYYGVQRGSVTRHRTKTRTVTDSNGKKRTETYQEAYQVTVWKDTKGNFSRNGKQNIIARKHTAFYGFSEFNSTLFLDNVVDFDFEKVKDANSEFINAEVEPNEAQMEAYGDIENKNRSMAASNLHKLVRCDSEITVENPLYVHSPLWSVRYRLEDKIYKVSVAGDSGKVVKGEVPITTKQRIINYVLGTVLILVSAILGNFGIQMSAIEDTAVIGIILIILGVVGISCSAIPIRKAFKMQLEKSSMKEIKKERRISLKAAKKALRGGK